MRKAVADAIERLADDGSDAVAEAAIKASGTLGLSGLGARLAGVAQDARKTGRIRTAALDVLDGAKHEGFDKILRKLTTDSDSSVRALVLEKLGKRDPAGTVPMLETALRVGTLRERQRAFSTLAKIDAREADAVLRAELGRFVGGRGEPELELDLYEAIGKRKDKALAQDLAAWLGRRDPADPVTTMHEALHGGSREAGERIFKTKTEAQCTKCHRIGGEGVVAGPDLKGVGKRLSREKLLESLLAPSKIVAEGFGTVAVEMKDSRVLKGVLKAETATELDLVDDNGATTKVLKEDIETRADPVSAMTPMGSILSKRELRDVVEFLASLDE
jgi:putative heme-binding domain-containing protein